jgi:hypothetical protein
MLLFRCLFQTIKLFDKSTNFLFLSINNKPIKLFHVNLLIKVIILKNCFHIYLMYFKLINNCNDYKYFYESYSWYMWLYVKIVQTFLLFKTFNNKSNFIFVNSVINFHFSFKDSLMAKWFTSRRKIHLWPNGVFPRERFTSFHVWLFIMNLILLLTISFQYEASKQTLPWSRFKVYFLTSMLKNQDQCFGYFCPTLSKL